MLENYEKIIDEKILKVLKIQYFHVDFWKIRQIVIIPKLIKRSLIVNLFGIFVQIFSGIFDI